MSWSVQEKALRIDAPSEAADKIDRYLEPLIGSPPTESPTFDYFAHTYVDSRTRSVQTIQYRSTEVKDGIMANRILQDSIRSALWTQYLGGLLSKKDLPDVSFDECQAPSERPYCSRDETVGVVNLHFTSERVLQCVRRNIKEISVGQGNEGKVYALAETSHLDGRIFIFDCLNFQLDTMDVEALFAALEDMTKDLGKLLGLAKLVAKPKDSTRGMERAGHTTVRGYLKLADPWLAVPLSRLVNQLPYRFLWHGIPHPLLYVGYDERYRDRKDSADYPLKNSVAEEEQEEAKDSPCEAGGEEGEASPARRSKRRRKGKEE